MRVDADRQATGAGGRRTGKGLTLWKRAARWIAAPWRVLARVLDRLDERSARKRRRTFGKRGLLVSWVRDPDGLWRARLSGPRTVRTIERSARTRVAAINRAARVLDRLAAARARIHDDEPPPEPTDRFQI